MYTLAEERVGPPCAAIVDVPVNTYTDYITELCNRWNVIMTSVYPKRIAEDMGE